MALLHKALAGRTALVTGSTSGIGLAVADALAAEGADVMLNGLGEPDAIERLRADLAERHGVRVRHDGADMRRPAEIAAMVRGCGDAPGGPDILVNNAGIQFVAAIEAFPEERWDAIIAINLSAAFHATKAAIPAMRARGWGRIVNIASAHGLVASPLKSAYVAAKHGVVGLTKATALELANDGITANAICPGWVLTPLVEAQLRARADAAGSSVEAETQAFLTEKQAMARFTKPEAVGGLAVFLCSDHAATMTGSVQSIDGGWVAA